MNIKLETYILPASWACAFMYGDMSGLSDEECEAIDAFEAQSGHSTLVCVDVRTDDCDFRTYHDARHVYPYAADVGEFVFDTGE